MSHSTSSLEPSREKYAETVQYKILDWYLTIGRQLVTIGEAVDSLRMSGFIDIALLGYTATEIMGVRRSIQLFVATLFITEDMPKVKKFDDCLKEAMQRAGRKTIGPDIEMRKKSYMEGRLWAEDNYEAVLLQHESLRDIVASRKWFDINGQPDKRKHTLDLK